MKAGSALAKVYQDGLLNDTVCFWFPRSVDKEQGGLFHCFDHDGSVSVPLKGKLWKSLFHHSRMQ